MYKTYIVIILYFIITFLVALYFSKKESIQSYLLNNKSSGLRLLVFSNVATIIGAGAVITTMSETYDSGISFGITTLFSFIIGAAILGVIARKIVKSGNKHNIFSIVDFFRERFDKKNEILILIIQLILLLIRTAVQIIAMSYLINTLTGINYYLSILISAGITILYTAIGGLKIDIITDFIQFRIIISVFIALTIIGYQHVGGITHLVQALPASKLNPFNFGGIGFFVGTIIFGGLIYIPNPSHRQRILSAKNEKIGQASFFLSIPFLLIIISMVIFLGLISSIMIKGMNHNQSAFEIIKILSANKWMLGIGFACLLAVTMSSLDSILIAGSTIMYKGFMEHRGDSPKKSITKARLLTAGFGSIGILIAMVLPDISTRSIFCSYIAMTLVPATIAGLYFPKISAKASFYSITVSIISLFALYPIVGKNVFLISTAMAIIIITLYDKCTKCIKT